MHSNLRARSVMESVTGDVLTRSRPVRKWPSGEHICLASKSVDHHYDFSLFFFFFYFFFFVDIITRVNINVNYFIFVVFFSWNSRNGLHSFTSRAHRFSFQQLNTVRCQEANSPATIFTPEPFVFPSEFGHPICYS